MSPGCSWLALNPSQCCLHFIQDLPYCTNLSGLTPRLPAGYLGHGGSCAEREVTTMNEGPSHLAFPSRTSLVPAQSVALRKGRQRQAITAVTNPVLSSALVQLTPVSEPFCSLRTVHKRRIIWVYICPMLLLTPFPVILQRSLSFSSCTWGITISLPKAHRRCNAVETS